MDEKRIEPGRGEKEADILTHTISRETSVVPVVEKYGIRLHPQPTGDPLDPLNWSSVKKHTILAIVMALYFMFTYITTTTVPSFPELMDQYDASLSQINWTVAIPALGLAIGPPMWASPADILGRRVIFITGTIIALAATIGAAKAPTYGGYMASRFFQGLGVAPASTVGLAIINDMFFEHQRAQKVGLWCLALDMGLLVGPLIGGFIDLVDHYWIEWLTAILFGAILLAEILFLPETLYPRRYMLERMPYTLEKVDAVEFSRTAEKRSSAAEVSLKRTTKLPLINLRPVPGLRHPLPWASFTRFIKTFPFLVITISVSVYCFAWYWWILSIITFIPSAYIQYSPQIQGLLFLGLIIGTLISEIFFSGTLSDYLILKLAKKNNGIRVPEMRLWLAYPAALLSAAGLILWGISVDQDYHWIVGQVAFALFAAGIQMGNTAICSYIVDCYPLQSMAIITFYSVVISVSAFVNPFFIAPWVEASGYTWTFSTQGIITAVLGCSGIAFVHWKGAAIRAWNGQPSWLNPEYDIST